jgi:hypothetical protein
VLVARGDLARHPLGALEMARGVVRVLEEELADPLLVPAAGRDRLHVLAGQDDDVGGLPHHAAGDPHVVGQRGEDALGESESWL